ncbi:DUF4283 domain-containing protein [Citrus sinensis]|uniref:DUF4283 domain-containing protein n=1 Tax=Citrus sinensis TaxID=2711 RepID=A0ACB8NTJ0_CITSI|nr:DUF4283 domain-containing protein [Citrus sinensis]
METSLEKSSPPSIENNRSTKRAKFKAQGVDGDNPPPVSFRDKLLETQMELEEEFMGKEEDIDIDIGDVVIEMERFLPAISFSQKVHLQLVKPWQSTVVVKLLGRSIGYKKISSVVAWIRLPGMPLHYYHKKVLRLLGQVIRNVICIDYNTESTTRGKFARIAVEVALDKLLCSQFLLDSKIQKVEYESLPTICFECGIYGYLISSCQKKIANEEVEAAVQSANPRFRPWMVVAKKGNHRAHKESLGMIGQGSCFGPLTIINENDKDIISNNTTIAKEARWRSTFSPNSHSLFVLSIMQHKGALHAHAKPNHVPMHKEVACKKPSLLNAAISYDLLVLSPRA